LTIACAAFQKKYEKNIVNNPFPRSTTMSMETSERFLAKVTANELEEYKKWLGKQFL
jgi:hypothetical protein